MSPSPWRSPFRRATPSPNRNEKDWNTCMSGRDKNINICPISSYHDNGYYECCLLMWDSDCCEKSKNKSWPKSRDLASSSLFIEYKHFFFIFYSTPDTTIKSLGSHDIIWSISIDKVHLCRVKNKIKKNCKMSILKI